MDPRISAGFSILGNALMPDPARLAQASVLRSQMLQNEAQTGKLSAETETILRTQENLRLLQDLMANPDSTSNDVISRALGAGITNDPSQIPRMFLGAEGVENLNVNDPLSLSTALSATGTVAGWGNTPVGFAADQSRQTAEAAAKDLTERRSQDITSRDARYDTETDAATSIETQRMQDLREIGIATADRNLTQAVEAAQLAKDYYDINKDSNDANIRLGAEERRAQADRALTAAIDRNTQATRLEQTRMEGVYARGRNDATITGELTRARETATANATSAAEVAKINAASDAEVARINQGGGAAGGDPLVNVSWSDRDAAEGHVMATLAKRLYPAGETTDRATVLKNIDWYADPVPPDVMQAAIRFGFQIAGEKNPVGAAEIAAEVTQWDPDNERWVLDTGGFPAVAPSGTVAPLPAAGSSPLLDSVQKYIARPEGTAPAPAPAATVPDTTQEAVGDDADGEPFWLSPDGTHYVYANGKPVK